MEFRTDISQEKEGQGGERPPDKNSSEACT